MSLFLMGLIQFSYARIKSGLTLSKLILICNYFYSKTMTAVTIVVGVNSFLKRRESVYCLSKHFLKWGKKVYRLSKHIYVFSVLLLIIF